MDRSVPKLALSQVFGLTTALIAAAVLALFYGFVESSRRSILRASEQLRDATATQIADLVSRDLGEADRAFMDIERELDRGAIALDDRDSVEAALFLEMVRHERYAELAFTHGTKLGFDRDGDIELAEDGRWQISLWRPKRDDPSIIHTRTLVREDGRFACSIRERPAHGTLREVPFRPDGNGNDPTEHLTFKTTASATVAGRAIWSDLSYAEADSALAASARRIVVTEQKVIVDREQRFRGVLRAGLLTETVDAIARFEGAPERHQIFICDDRGRLVTRLSASDPIEELDDDLRVVPASVPAPIAMALASPLVQSVSDDHPSAAGAIEVGGERHLVTFRALPDTQGWIVGVVVPEDAYTHDLEAQRSRFLIGFGAVIAFILLAGALVLRALRSSLFALVGSTSKMQRFDFSAGAAEVSFRDVHTVIDGLERAKTALRAMQKYVPMDLVRALYRENKESQLGAELRALTIMFTDIRGFTGLSEKLPPDRLARALGLYLEVMSAAIQEQQGTIDKFIGDAVMAFWNAPAPVEHHTHRACKAALECVKRTRALYASSAWEGLPPLTTSFGLHRDEVMVGNFGAPERLNYTALGDGVNIAARLEGLSKLYGTTIIVSEAVEREVRGAFELRLLDVVAVKGRKGGVKLFELLGEAGAPIAGLDAARAYERAFEAYRSRSFTSAAELLAAQEAADPPSRTLLARCKEYCEEPPPADWDGTYVATSK